MSWPTVGTLLALPLLQARRDWPGYVLAQRLDVTTRTVRRDVDRLRALGYRIESTKGPDGGYRLAAGSELPPLLFDEEQAVAIAVGLQHAAASGVDVGDAADRALATVRQVMPSHLRNRVDAVRFSVPSSRRWSTRTCWRRPAAPCTTAPRCASTTATSDVASRRPHGRVAPARTWFVGI